MMRHYCTLFDRNYLARGLALHRSLLRHGGEFTLHVLCLDQETREALSALALPRANLIGMDSLEKWDPALRAVRPGRAPAEFYFTCKPVLLSYLLDRHPGARRLTYLDSDLFYFSDATAAEQEFAASPVALSPHRFSASNVDRVRYGRFNAGWVSVNGSSEARRFVAWWRDRCIEWCYLVEEESRFGDQKYLDRVPELFPGTALVSPGVNAGPWTLDASKVGVSGDQVTISGRPLVVFHFHGVRRMLFRVYDCGVFQYGVRLDSRIKRGIYLPYVRELASCSRLASSLGALDTTPKARGFAGRIRETVGLLRRKSALFALA